jgi:hypothetical protein
MNDLQQQDFQLYQSFRDDHFWFTTTSNNTPEIDSDKQELIEKLSLARNKNM